MISPLISNLLPLLPLDRKAEAGGLFYPSGPANATKRFHGCDSGTGSDREDRVQMIASLFRFPKIKSVES
jgi:hypothetical protein